MKPIPQAVISERYVISHLLSDITTHYKIFGYLSKGECFTNPTYRAIFETVLQLKSEGRGIDMVSVAQGLPEYMDEIVKISGEVTSGAMVEEHTLAVYEAYARRELAIRAQAFKEQMFNPSYDILDAINEFAEYQNGLLKFASQSDIHISEALKQMLDLSKRMHTKDESLRAVKTGFTYFDDFSGGIQRGDLVVVAGETSNGKTTLSLNIMHNAAKGYNGGTPSAIFSYEMTIPQLAARLAAYETGKESKGLLMGKYTLEEIDGIGAGCAKLSNSNIYLTKPSSTNFTRLTTDIVRIVKQHGIELVVIDYLQLLSNPTAGTNAEQVGEMANRLKVLAVELNISILLISQLARDRANTKPTIARLKSSGDIENAADTVLLSYLPYKYGKYTEKVQGETVDIGENAIVIVGKGRNIGTTEFILEFRKEVPAFYNYHKNDDLPIPKPLNPRIEKKHLPF